MCIRDRYYTPGSALKVKKSWRLESIVLSVSLQLQIILAFGKYCAFCELAVTHNPGVWKVLCFLRACRLQIISETDVLHIQALTHPNTRQLNVSKREANHNMSNFSAKFLNRCSTGHMSFKKRKCFSHDGNLSLIHICLYW